MTRRALFAIFLVPGLALATTSGCSCDGETDGAGGAATGTGTATAQGGAAGATNQGGGGTGGASGCTTSDQCNGGVCIAGACCESVDRVCGASCCTGSTVCLFDNCVTPGDPCQTAADCDPGQYCETALGDGTGGGGTGGGTGTGGTGTGGGGPTCTAPVPLQGKCLDLPPKCDVNDQPPGCVAVCEYFPGTGPLDAVKKYQWGPVAQVSPNHTDVWSTPTVGRVFDANCDGNVDELDPPNIIFVSGNATDVNTGLGTCCHCSGAAVSRCRTGVLRMLDGRTGEEIWSLATPGGSSVGFAGFSVAIGDVDKDGRMDIAAVNGEGYVVLIDDTGVVKRTSDLPIPGQGNATFGWGGGLSIADIDGDGFPEIAYGRTVYTTTNAAITLKFTGTGGMGGGNIYQALSTFVDLDGAADNHLELLAGNTAYKSDGSILWNRTDLTDGFPAVGDFDGDSLPEAVLVTNDSVLILDGATGVTAFGPLALPGNGFGGPPTVADFDGDGAAEIGVAQQNIYSVLKPAFNPDVLNVMWQVPNHDLSSSVTGSSVFDFEGDGRAEVIYADECFLWVYDGQTGAVRFSAPTTSFTATEASIVADVDGDGRSEIVMVSNHADPSSAGWGCMDSAGNPTVVNGVTWTPSPAADKGYRGITVFGDKANAWVGTRTLWNQHAYHVSNICDDRDSACALPNLYGSIPTVETKNWALPWLNNFRQNVQDQGLFDAPDATVSLFVPCTNDLTASVSVRNIGFRSLPAPVDVGVYIRIAGVDTLVGQGATTQTLFPGQTQVFDVTVNTLLATKQSTFVAKILLDPLNATFHECREDNNESSEVKPPCVQ